MGFGYLKSINVSRSCVGHRGWNAADDSASARFALNVSIVAENPELRVYEPVRVELDRIRARSRIQIAAAPTGAGSST